MTLLILILKVALVALLAPLAGAVIRGIDRKLTARVQGRIGPPLLQPIYDILKLLRKQPIVVNRVQVLYVVLHLAFMVLAMLFLVLGQDSLMMLFVLAFSTLSLVLGGMSVRSPYSRIGSQREILMMVAYEPILVLMVVGFYLVSGSFQMEKILEGPQPLMLQLPLIFLAYLIVVAIKLQKSPFDLATSHHAHQEIVKGITLEISGPYLAIVEITHCYETIFFLAWIGLFWATNVFVAVALMVGAFLGAVLLDNVFARLTTLWMFKFMWTVGLGLALTNILWLYW